MRRSHGRGRRARTGGVRRVARLVSLFALALVAVLGVAPGGSGADDASLHGFYLALGASLSLGYQPTADSPDGAPTAEGYANDLVAHEAARGVDLQLTQLGCVGENTVTMISGADTCYHSDGSQLAAAVSFLTSHRDEAGLVTIDLGFNNVMSCLRDHDVEGTCVESHLFQVRADMAAILDDVRSAAGPDVTIVGLTHYDPFVADADPGRLGRSFAKKSADALARLNDTLTAVYHDAGVPVADVAGAFGDGERVSATGPEGTVAARAAARTCALTWMCQPAPFGPDVHPNAAGYAVIAAAIEDVLPSPW